MQLHSGENGMATLAMILAWYKKYPSAESIRQECLASRNNTSVRQMIAAGEAFGLSAQVFRNPTTEMIRAQSTPVVIRVGRFYEIVTGFKNGKICLISSSCGKYALTEEAFEKYLDGSTAIVYTPAESFVPDGKPEGFFAPVIRRFRENKKDCIVLLFLYLLAAAATVGMLFVSRRMMDECLNGGNPARAPFLMAAIVCITVLDIAAAVVTPLIVFRSSRDISAKSSSALYKKLLSLPMHFFETHFNGDLIDRVANNITLGKKFLSEIISKLVDLLLVFVFLLVLFLFNPVMAAVCLAAEIIFIIAYMTVVSRIGVISRSLSVLQSNVSANTLNGINLIETIKTTGAERSFFKVWCRAESDYDNKQKSLLKLNALASLLNDLSDFLAQGLLLFVGAVMMINGNLTFGVMAVFQTLINQLQKNIRKSLLMMKDYQSIKADIERSDDILQRESRKEVEIPEEPDKLSGNIVFDHVTFRYNKGDEPVLRDISFEFRHGEIIALVGKTGSGKSTILKLLSDLYTRESGSILIDGRPIEEIPTAVLRSSVATVDQDVMTYADTVRNNLKLWDNCIEDYEMILAARDAQIHPRIISSPDGYDGMIEEHGRNFSGGELQRLALARALSAEPTILILDEFTSALDVITEKKVFEAIRNRNAGVCVLAAHRLSTVMLCDRVLVIDEGRIAEEGTPAELYQRGGKFRKLVDSGG